MKRILLIALALVLALPAAVDAKTKKKAKGRRKKGADTQAMVVPRAGEGRRAPLVYDGASTGHTSGADPDLLVVNAVGDVAWPDGWGGVDIVDEKQHHLFDAVRPWLDSGDLNFANIECPLTYLAPRVQKTYPITCDPKRLNYVLDAGFNLFSLANNHALDAGVEGLEDTLANFRAANREDRPVWFAGAGASADEARAPVLVKVPGKHATVALLAVSASGSGLVGGFGRDLPARITEARKRADIVIVSTHAGPEYEHVATRTHAELYRAWIDAGADVVLGHHPHVVQGIERYRQGIILYSMGNFSFGSRTKRHRETGARLWSMVARLTFRKGKLVDARVVPLWASNTDTLEAEGESLAPTHCSPRVLVGAFARRAIAELQQFSDEVPGAQPTRIALEGDLGVVDLGLPAEERAKAAPPPPRRKVPRVVW